MNTRKIAFSLVLSTSLLSSAAMAQGGSPAQERLCFLMGGLAGAIADYREKGSTYDELLPMMGAATKDEQSKQDQIAMLKLIYEKKLSGSDARKEIYFRCMVGDYKSAWKL